MRVLCIKHKSKSLISAPHSLKFTRCRRLAMYHLHEYGPKGDQPVGLRAFLNADHYLTTDTITQYDRYLRDLQGLQGNVAPSVLVVSLDDFVDWVTRTLEERAVPHERTLFCVSDVIVGYRGHHWFAVWVDFMRGSTGRVRSRTDRGAEPAEQPDRDSHRSRRTRRKT
jgi:hypothetical protein